MRTRKKVGLALGSGGVRGLAHVGVIRALLAHDIPIDYIAGSSIGAWVGAHFSLFQDMEILTELTVGKRREKLRALFEPSWHGGLIGGKKIQGLLSRWLGSASFHDTVIPFAAVTTDVVKREMRVFTEGELVPAIQASMAIPGIFKPIVHEGHVLIDGGVSNPVPIDVVRRMGADIVIGVNLYRLSEQESGGSTDAGGFMDVTRRTLEIMHYSLAAKCMESADIAIEPPVGRYAGWTDYFMERDGERVVEMGAIETERIMPILKKILQ